MFTKNSLEILSVQVSVFELLWSQTRTAYSATIQDFHHHQLQFSSGTHDLNMCHFEEANRFQNCHPIFQPLPTEVCVLINRTGVVSGDNTLSLLGCNFTTFCQNYGQKILILDLPHPKLQITMVYQLVGCPIRSCFVGCGRAVQVCALWCYFEVSLGLG